MNEELQGLIRFRKPFTHTKDLLLPFDNVFQHLELE